MRKIFKSGSVGGAPGNRCFYLERDKRTARFFGIQPCCQIPKLFKAQCSKSPLTPELNRSPVKLMKKRHGHYCRTCGHNKPNEAFSGKGHRTHVCKPCLRMPQKDRESIEQKEEIFHFLEQSHISKKNIVHLNHLVESSDKEVAYIAGIVLEVALVKPYKKKRLKVLARERRDLLEKLDETGLVFAHHQY